jgi:hypothetical protein
MKIFKSKLVITTFTISVLAISGLFLIKSRQTSAAIAPCIYNLMLIDLCKHNWANVNNKTAADVPTWNDLKSELSGYAIQYKWTNDIPVCPDGGIYTIGRVGEPPTCSIGGPKHSLTH